MDQLIIGALQKTGINRHHRFGAFAGQTSSKGYGMLLGNRGIEILQREFL